MTKAGEMREFLRERILALRTSHSANCIVISDLLI